MCRCLSANTGNQIKPTFSVEIAEQERRTVVRQRPQHWRLRETRSVIIDFDLMNYCLVECICQGARTDPANDTVRVFFKTKGLVVPSLRNRRQTHWQNDIAFIHSLGVGDHSGSMFIQNESGSNIDTFDFFPVIRGTAPLQLHVGENLGVHTMSCLGVNGPWSGSVGDSRFMSGLQLIVSKAQPTLPGPHNLTTAKRLDHRILATRRVLRMKKHWNGAYPPPGAAFGSRLARGTVNSL